MLFICSKHVFAINVMLSILQHCMKLFPIELLFLSIVLVLLDDSLFILILILNCRIFLETTFNLLYASLSHFFMTHLFFHCLNHIILITLQRITILIQIDYRLLLFLYPLITILYLIHRFSIFFFKLIYF